MMTVRVYLLDAAAAVGTEVWIAEKTRKCQVSFLVFLFSSKAAIGWMARPST